MINEVPLEFCKQSPYHYFQILLAFDEVYHIQLLAYAPLCFLNGSQPLLILKHFPTEHASESE